MLRSLHIKNIVLIESLQIPFGNGLCVLTGETGAGKSILLDALGLALGQRADAKLVRHGEEQGSVTAEFEYNPRANVALDGLLKEHAIEGEDNLLLKRIVTAQGKSRASINGEPVSQSILQAVGGTLIEVHGQHDQRGLMDAAVHRAMLDAYSGNADLVRQVHDSYHHWRRAEEAYQTLLAHVEKAREEEEYLNHVLGELNTLNPEPGEEEKLSDARAIMMHREKAVETLNEALSSLSGKHNVLSSISNAERVLHRAVIPQAEDMFEGILQALDRSTIELNEATQQMESLLRDFSEENDSLEHTEERLFALRAAARKYNVAVDELAQYRDSVAAELQQLAHQDEDLSRLQEARVEAKKAYSTAADELSALRALSAKKLSAEIGKELAPLKMENAALEPHLTTLDEAEWGEGGKERVQFLVRTNPGSPFGMMNKIASGGELSRFMLALKVVLSSVNAVPTMIFDEIDTGIGGATADAVGRRLASIAREQQVLCVTHQPQVAAYGNHHLKIEKASDGTKTITSVSELTGDVRKEEIARMLAGENITDQARQAAITLMEATA